jgi:hypothetical protein
VAGVKSTDNSTTLMHYLIEYVERHCPDVRSFTEALPLLNKATRVESVFINAEIKQVFPSLSRSLILVCA